MLQYNNIFKDYLDNGIIERDDTPADNNEVVHYLPYHPVVLKDKKTTNSFWCFFENENSAITWGSSSLRSMLL